MKKLLSIIASGMAVATALTACDSVSEEDRFIPAEIVPQRAILLEEFTGQNCPNCPDGHVAIHDILITLGDSVVPVSIHASDLAIPASRGGLKTDAGESYYQNAGSPPEPTAVINLQTRPLQIADWGANINRLIMTSTPFTVAANGKQSADAKNYEIEVAFSSGEDYNGKLMVWIVENDIVARQLDHKVTVYDYVHNHVFRAVASELWGDPVDLKAHVAQKKTYSYPIDATWNVDNLYVVAFLYNDDGVAQVTSSGRE